MTADPRAIPSGGVLTRWPARLAASVLLAVLLPPALLVWLSSRLERRALRDDLEARAQVAAALTDALLSHAEAFLARLGNRWDGGCSPDTAETLRSAVDVGLAVRDASLLDTSLAPVCSVGAVPLPLPAPSASPFTATAGPSGTVPSGPARCASPCASRGARGR